jgi:GTP1/Obg family GTP-binding protein
MNFNIIISLHSFHTFLITNLKKKYSSKYEKSWNTNRLKLFFLKKFNLISNFIQTYLLRLLDNCPDIKSYNRCELEIFNILCNNNYYKIARNIVFIVINRIRRLERGCFLKFRVCLSCKKF